MSGKPDEAQVQNAMDMVEADEDILGIKPGVPDYDDDNDDDGELSDNGKGLGW
jgi:hypothetical protein